jgi:SAM-dependent methyltransferase
MARGSSSKFLEAQEDFFTRPDTGHFFWQTRNPYVSRTERELLNGVSIETGQRLLEVGCGEGGNLVNLLDAHPATPRLAVGLDLFGQKLAFARGQGVPAEFVCADAGVLPFRDGAFDVVLCRDLLHHLEVREPAVAELRRVTRRGGTVWIVEPNGRNPLVQFLSVIRPHERGQLRNSPESVRRLVAAYFPDVQIELRQPMPLSRLVLHYQYGAPRLGASRRAGAVLDAGDRAVGAVWPRRWWAYIVARAIA